MNYIYIARNAVSCLEFINMILAIKILFVCMKIGRVEAKISQTMGVWCVLVTL